MSYDNFSSVSQNVLKFYRQLTGEETQVIVRHRIILQTDGQTDGGRAWWNQHTPPPYNFIAGGIKTKHCLSSSSSKFQKKNLLREAKLIPLIHKCMTDHFTKTFILIITRNNKSIGYVVPCNKILQQFMTCVL
jgi:hypothetical protein